jgi:hypothetical protein
MSELELLAVKLHQDTESYQPGLAWDLERGLLYIAHADEDRITVVDLAEGVVKIQSDILRPRSHFDRFIDWLMPTAAAKGGPVTIRRALLSEDGRMLSIAPLFGEYETIEEPDISTDLLIVETERLEEVGRLELGTIVDMQLAPNGRDLLVRSYGRISTRAGHRLTKIDPTTGEMLGQLALPEPDAEGVFIVGFNKLDITDTEATLRVQYGTPESHHVEEIRIDLEALTILSQEVVDDETRHTFLEPE